MRTRLFNLVGSFGENFIDTLRSALEFSINTQTAIADALLASAAHVFKFILWSIDGDRVNHAEEAIRQSSLSAELEVLMTISKVKEDAISIGFWRENHSMALNELGSRLYNECEWEEGEIHRYMRTIVESIPGLTYAITDDDDDDEDEGIRLEDR